MKYFYITTALTLILFSMGCNSSVQNDRKSQAILEMKRATDFHSFSQPEEAVVTHLNWNASVNFDDRIIRATAVSLQNASYSIVWISRSKQSPSMAKQLNGQWAPPNLSSDSL
jgi:hypothetical protein